MKKATNHRLAEHATFVATKQVLPLSVYGIESAGGSGWLCWSHHLRTQCDYCFLKEIVGPQTTIQIKKNMHWFIFSILGGIKYIYICLWLCGFCPSRPQQNCETGEVSSLGPSEATVTPLLMVWVRQLYIRCSGLSLLFATHFKYWFGNPLLFTVWFQCFELVEMLPF